MRRLVGQQFLSYARQPCRASAGYDSLVAVVAGTTMGMMLADVPAVFLGDKIAKR
jgi:hypothetical protein